MQVISLKEITQESKFSNDFLQLPMNFLHKSLVIQRYYKDIKFVATRGRGGGGGRGAKRLMNFSVPNAALIPVYIVHPLFLISFDLDLLLFFYCFIFVL